MMDAINNTDYSRFASLVREGINGNYEGKIAIIGIGYSGEEFYDKKLSAPFEMEGIKSKYYKMRQSDDRTKDGLRDSEMSREIDPEISKALFIERSARTGKSLISANLHVLRKIFEDRREKSGRLNLCELYNLVAEDEADLGHFQINGTNLYGKRGGRTIFRNILREQLPSRHDELNDYGVILGEDMFLNISNIPHLRFNEYHEHNHGVPEDRRLATKAAFAAIGAAATSHLISGGKRDR